MKSELSRELVLVNKLGLHARAAAKIAAIAVDAAGEIWLHKGSESADAKSTIDILTLACPQGCRLTLSIQTPEDMPLMEKITKLVKQGFGEAQ
ncbi:MAG: HPr family phosphocarrier protein [Desulfobacterales bacterium]